MRFQPFRSQTRRIPYRWILALAIGLLPATAQAQMGGPPGGIAPPPRPERPYRGLFGGGVGNTEQSLTLEGSLGGGYVENPIAEQTGVPAELGDQGRLGGASGVGTAVLDYSLYRTRWGAHAGYTALIDYYPHLEQHSLQDRHVMGASVYFLPTQRTRINITGAFKNFPEFSVSDLFDGTLEQAVPINQDFPLSLIRYTRWGTSVDVSHSLTSRTVVNAGVSYAHGKVASSEWVIRTGSGMITHMLGKGIALYLGYQEGGQAGVAEGVRQPIERQPRISGGVNLARALSFSRRTTVAFSTGLAGTQDSALDETTYNVIGSVRLAREFGRSWVAKATYSRDVRRVEPLSESILSDMVTVGVGGSFGARVQFGSYLNNSFGAVATTRAKIDSLIGGIQVSAAINRQLAWGADYAYSRYSTDADFLVESLRTRDNQSFRTYLQVWLPLFQRSKRP